MQLLLLNDWFLLVFLMKKAASLSMTLALKEAFLFYSIVIPMFGCWILVLREWALLHPLAYWYWLSLTLIFGFCGLILLWQLRLLLVAQNYYLLFLILLLIWLINYSTSILIIISMQAEVSDTRTLHKLINCLYSSQEIDRNLINNLEIAESPELSCYFGLINLLYNIICEKQRDFKQALKARINTQTYKKGRLLQIQGQILRNYVNLSFKFLPGPAFYLASFDFVQFNNYCMKRGLVSLLRQSRGLYPLVDTATTPVLQFLLFYEQFKQGQGSLIGNQNWQTARKFLQTFYDQQIKQGQGPNNTGNSNSTKINVNELDDDKVDSETKQKNAIRLCYMILAGRKYEMKEYIAMLTDFYVLNKRQQQDESVAQIAEMIRKFAIWYQNYNRFVEDGLKLYQGELQFNNQLFHGGGGDAIQQIIIRLIQQISQFHLASVQRQSNQKVQGIRLDLQKLMEFSKQLGEYQNLFICYLHVIGKRIELQPPLNTTKFYIEANGNSLNSKNQEAYNRIMFSDTELIQFYEKGDLTNFPSSYNFGNQLLLKIMRIICKKDDIKTSLNLERFVIFSSNAEKLRILIGNKKLAQFSAEKAKNEGEEIVNYIKKNLQVFSKQLVNQKGQIIEQKKAKQHINTFIQQWELFYCYMKKFNFDLLYKLIKNYETKSEGTRREQQKRNNDKVYFGHFHMPLRNPYVVYRIVNQFVEKAKNAKQKFLTCFELYQSKPKQAAIQNQYLDSTANFEKCIQLFKNPMFRDMVQFSHPEPGNEQKKQDYEDQIWKQYAQIILIFPENWWSQARIQAQQSQLMTRRNPQIQEQQPIMEEMIDQDVEQAQKIQEEQMENEDDYQIEEEDEDEDEDEDEGEDQQENQEGYDSHDD